MEQTLTISRLQSFNHLQVTRSNRVGNFFAFNRVILLFFKNQKSMVGVSYVFSL
jgi:hypothetical protein